MLVSVSAHAPSNGETYTEDNNEQKVHVGDIVELEPQILWHETERRVLCGSYLVARVVCDRVAVFVTLGLGQGHVEVDSSSGIWVVSTGI
jgi:hypothetical protein